MTGQTVGECNRAAKKAGMGKDNRESRKAGMGKGNRAARNGDHGRLGRKTGNDLNCYKARRLVMKIVTTAIGVT